MVGMLRAWKVSAEAGLARAACDADVSERHIDARVESSGGARCGKVGSVCTGSVDASASLVDAIWVSREARSLRRSV